MRSKGRVGIAVVALALVGAVVWHCREGAELVSSETRVSSTAHVSPANDPITGTPRWLVAGVDGRRIGGIVLGEDGAPVRGASVSLASTLTMAGAARAGKRVTDEAGRFDFGAQPAVAYLVVAESPRLTGVAQQVDLRDSTVVSDQLRFVLHACQASIYGTIRENGGGVVPGATIARAANGLSTGGVEADAAAGYELCVPPGGAAVAVTADGYVAVRENVNVFGRVRRDFTLRPATSVVGRVVRAGDRTAVAGAIVEIVAADPRNAPVPLTASSDGDGRFHIDGVAPGRQLVHARADRFATLDPVEVIAELGTANDVICELVPTFTISGQVIAKGTKAPLADVAVFVSSDRGNPRRQDTRSRSDGTFVFDHIHAGDHEVDLGRDIEGEQDVKVEASDVRVTLEVDAPATISGRVVHAGKPVDDASVRPRLEDPGPPMTTVRTDHEGRFTLRPLAPGTYRLYAESNRLGAFTPGPSITVATGERRTDVVIDLDLSASVAGIVVDQNGAPVAGAYLQFSLLGGSDFGQATTAEDGRFIARGMSGGGDYIYEVSPHPSANAYPPKVGKRFSPIAVRDGNTHVEGVRIEVRVERFAIAGRVVDANGGPAADVTVRAGATYGDDRDATTDASGAFRIRDLAAGTYWLRATAPHGEARMEVTAGRTDLVLRLQPNGAIAGTLEGFGTVPAVHAFRFDDLRQPHRAAVDGTKFTIRDLPPGEYQVFVPHDASRARVSVSAGQTAKVTLRKQEYGSILVTVVDEKRKPVSGVYCNGVGVGNSMPVTNASGEARIDRLPAGTHMVLCSGDAIEVMEDVTVIAGQTTRIELVAKPPPPRAYAGLTFDLQLGEVRVATVVPNGPAARAGVVVGDVVLELDESAVGRWMIGIIDYNIERHSLDTPLKLTLERNDKRVTVSITLQPAP